MNPQKCKLSSLHEIAAVMVFALSAITTHSAQAAETAVLTWPDPTGIFLTDVPVVNGGTAYIERVIDLAAGNYYFNYGIQPTGTLGTVYNGYIKDLPGGRYRWDCSIAQDDGFYRTWCELARYGGGGGAISATSKFGVPAPGQKTYWLSSLQLAE